MTVQVVGIEWFRREYYPELLGLFDDGNDLPRTYDEWFAKAEALRKELHARGIRVVRAYIDPIAFTEWCAIEGLPRDANARLDYAEWIAANSTLGRA